MSRPRIWLRLGIAAVVFVVLPLGHIVGFDLFGPPRHWTDSVSRKPLRTRDAGESPALAYREEFRQKWGPERRRTPPPLQVPASGGSYQGRPVFYESILEPRIELLQTSAKRLYFRRDASWRELSLPAEISLKESRVAVRDGDEIVILTSSWNPWWPFENKYLRYLKSHFIPELRPEHGIYELEVPGGELRYLFPGHRLKPSPDRRRVAFLRSASSSGSHSLHILDLSTDEVKTLAAIKEGDPGSGISFEYAWSDDSRALGLWGWLYGHKGDVELIYTLDSDRFWDVKASGS